MSDEMVRVKLTTSRSGPSGSKLAGETHEFNPETAKRILDAGQGVPVAESPAERAEQRPAEDDAEERGE